MAKRAIYCTFWTTQVELYDKSLSNYNDSYKGIMSNNNNVNNNTILLNKLNYLINLVEEQKVEKTNYVTEELILYLFLGIFIIFILDSFVKITKYTRWNNIRNIYNKNVIKTIAK